MTLERIIANSKTGYGTVKNFNIPKGETMCPGGYLELYIHHTEDRSKPYDNHPGFNGQHPPHKEFINAGLSCSYCCANCPKRSTLKKYL